MSSPKGKKYEIKLENKKNNAMQRMAKMQNVTSAGLDPATSSVLTMRDNQLLQPANQ